uniref:Uncharacterized protein n=1 Tax=Labrus bergylta TaxID=56723 RepID=A0A3Q3GPU4_9LABR
ILLTQKCVLSAGLEQQNGHLTQVEVNEMLGLMSHIAAKVSSNDAVPGRVIFLCIYLFDVCCDIFLDVVLLQRLSSTLHGILLHVLRHVGIFDHCLPFRHGCPGKPKHSGGIIIIIIFTGALARTKSK